MICRARKGQAMLLATLSLGGVILGATTIAGILMIYQIRSMTDSEHSAQAILAADAGTEWALYDYYCNQNSTCAVGGTGEQSQPAFSNGSTINDPLHFCYDGASNPVLCSNFASAQYAISKGGSLTSRRAFYLSFSNSQATLP